jgi:hypothetical protein
MKKNEMQEGCYYWFNGVSWPQGWVFKYIKNFEYCDGYSVEHYKDACDDTPTDDYGGPRWVYTRSHGFPNLREATTDESDTLKEILGEKTPTTTLIQKLFRIFI